MILFVNNLRQAKRSLLKIYDDFVAQIRFSVVYLFALGWHVALWPACGPDLANRSGPP